MQGTVAEGAETHSSTLAYPQPFNPKPTTANSDSVGGAGKIDCAKTFFNRWGALVIIVFLTIHLVRESKPDDHTPAMQVATRLFLMLAFNFFSKVTSKS